MLRKWPLLFIIIPLLELYLIIKVGSYIGALWTVIIVVMTAIIGVNLLRMQGLSTLRRAQQNMEQGVMPAMEMLEGLALAVGGALLITPGFLTDTLGLICLIPATRRGIIRTFMARASVQTFGSRSSPGQPPFTNQPSGRSHNESGNGRTIEGEFHRKDDK